MSQVYYYPNEPMEVSRARAISEAAGKIIDTAKVEVNYMQVVHSTEGSGFMPQLGDGGGEPDELPAGVPEVVAAAVRDGRE